jgi:hypothetical protein
MVGVRVRVRVRVRVGVRLRVTANRDAGAKVEPEQVKRCGAAADARPAGREGVCIVLVQP